MKGVQVHAGVSLLPCFLARKKEATAPKPCPNDLATIKRLAIHAGSLLATRPVPYLTVKGGSNEACVMMIA